MSNLTSNEYSMGSIHTNLHYPLWKEQGNPKICLQLFASPTIKFHEREPKIYPFLQPKDRVTFKHQNKVPSCRRHILILEMFKKRLVFQLTETVRSRLSDMLSYRYVTIESR